jgi:hypothetical protein
MTTETPSGGGSSQNLEAIKAQARQQKAEGRAGIGNNRPQPEATLTANEGDAEGIMPVNLNVVITERRLKPNADQIKEEDERHEDVEIERYDKPAFVPSSDSRNILLEATQTTQDRLEQYRRDTRKRRIREGDIDEKEVQRKEAEYEARMQYLNTRLLRRRSVPDTAEPVVLQRNTFATVETTDERATVNAEGDNNNPAPSQENGRVSEADHTSNLEKLSQDELQRLRDESINLLRLRSLGKQTTDERPLPEIMAQLVNVCKALTSRANEPAPPAQPADLLTTATRVRSHIQHVRRTQHTPVSVQLDPAEVQRRAAESLRLRLLTAAALPLPNVEDIAHEVVDPLFAHNNTQVDTFILDLDKYLNSPDIPYTYDQREQITRKAQELFVELGYRGHLPPAPERSAHLREGLALEVSLLRDYMIARAQEVGKARAESIQPHTTTRAEKLGIGDALSRIYGTSYHEAAETLLKIHANNADIQQYANHALSHSLQSQDRSQVANNQQVEEGENEQDTVQRLTQLYQGLTDASISNWFHIRSTEANKS